MLFDSLRLYLSAKDRKSVTCLGDSVHLSAKILKFNFPILRILAMYEAKTAKNEYTCLADFVHPRKLQRSGGTYFPSFTQSVYVLGKDSKS